MNSFGVFEEKSVSLHRFLRKYSCDGKFSHY